MRNIAKMEIYQANVGGLIDLATNNQESFLARFPLIEGVKVMKVIDVRLGRDHVQVVFTHPKDYPCNTEIPIKDYLEWAKGVV